MGNKENKILSQEIMKKGWGEKNYLILDQEERSKKKHTHTHNNTTILKVFKPKFNYISSSDKQRQENSKITILYRDI